MSERKYSETIILESLVCNNPKTSDNTVIKLDGNPYHMGSKVQVTCNGGRHFPNGLESVNVTCNPLPHPCMCLAEWMREDNFDLMNDFNCTGQYQFTRLIINIDGGLSI